MRSLTARKYSARSSLVMPVAANSTRSGWVIFTPAISSALLLAVGFLATMVTVCCVCTSLAGLSPRNPRKAGWRNRPSVVRSVKAIWATSLGSTQCASRADGARDIDERATSCRRSLANLRAEVVERRAVEAGADAAAIVQLTAFELAEQQGSERAALLVGDAVAADDELLVAEAFALQPAQRAARHVRLVGLLGDDAFEAEPAGLGENLGRRVRRRPRCSGWRRARPRSSFLRIALRCLSGSSRRSAPSSSRMSNT